MPRELIPSVKGSDTVGNGKQVTEIAENFSSVLVQNATFTTKLMIDTYLNSLDRSHNIDEMSSNCIYAYSSNTPSDSAAEVPGGTLGQAVQATPHLPRGTSHTVAVQQKLVIRAECSRTLLNHGCFRVSDCWEFLLRRNYGHGSNLSLGSISCGHNMLVNTLRVMDFHL